MKSNVLKISIIAIMLVLVYRKCSTCIKALKWLEENNVDFVERPIVEENPTYEDYLNFLESSKAIIR